MSTRAAPIALALILAVSAAPASAALPEPVRAMVEAAIATGDAAKVKTVVDIAKQTYPDDAPEIDALQSAFGASQREIAAAEQARKDAELRAAGLFDNWSGTGQVGAFQSSGNSDNVGVTLSLALNRTGVDWQHRLKAAADYQRSNGRTSREQYLAAYEPRYQVNGDLFSYALAQYERDRFQGFSSRYSFSGGLGYEVFDDDALSLTVKAGPSWRSVDYLDGTAESSFGGLAGMDFDWQIAKSLKLTQDANMVADSGGEATVIVDSISTSVLATTGLEAKISDGLTTRVSYTVDYNSNPPLGAVSTDTSTRFTLVYGF
jgi:putative salt-induced outer membrane protein